MFAPSLGPPSYPRNITFTTTCDHLTVAWAEPASDGGLPIKRYTVTLSDANQIIDTVYVTVGTNRFTFTNQDGVQPRTFYSISMQAANELNEGDKGEGNITSAYCKYATKAERKSHVHGIAKGIL